MNNLFAIYGSDFARQFSTSMRTPPSATAQRLADGTAVVDLSGTLSRDGRFGATSTDAVRTEIGRLANDHTVKRIVLRVNSPGGQSAGATALFDGVVEAAKQKPVISFIDDLGASAAYLAIAGSTKIIANRSALVGAIGTYAVVEDISGLAASMGVKVHVIKAGEFKGMGTPGTAFTEPQLQELQRVVNDINSQFLSAVVSGRKLTSDKLQIVSDGRIWIASDAQRYGLIDEIGTLETVLASPVTTSPGAMQRHQDPATDFYSRLQAQREQQGEQYLPRFTK